ncbi:MAG: AzlD domain-containing protein [Kiritimatiellae bacterium]|nr:AzlD domain-containing protein [Kiritimatiellia bacterium]
MLILVVAAASYALRALPLALLRRPMRNPRLVAFIERLPYALLAAMIVPDVFSSTGDPLSAAIGFAVALVLALLGRSLPLVAAAATAAAIAVVIALHPSPHAEEPAPSDPPSADTSRTYADSRQANGAPRHHKRRHSYLWTLYRQHCPLTMATPSYSSATR